MIVHVKLERESSQVFDDVHTVRENNGYIELLLRDGSYFMRHGSQIIDLYVEVIRRKTNVHTTTNQQDS